ncbi:unnamed protein product [Musa acuminata subsp. burmannicoides]
MPPVCSLPDKIAIQTSQKTQRSEHGEDSECGAKEGKGLLSGVGTVETRRQLNYFSFFLLQ